MIVNHLCILRLLFWLPPLISCNVCNQFLPFNDANNSNRSFNSDASTFRCVLMSRNGAFWWIEFTWFGLLLVMCIIIISSIVSAWAFLGQPPKLASLRFPTHLFKHYNLFFLLGLTWGCIRFMCLLFLPQFSLKCCAPAF